MSVRSRLDDLKVFVSACGWSWSPGKAVQYGEQIAITNGKDRASGTFYPKHGKLVLGGPASPLLAALQAWAAGEAVEPPAPPTAPEASASNPAAAAVQPLVPAGPPSDDRRAVVLATLAVRTGPPVEITQPVWQLAYNSSGFWRFTLHDGGILDWWSDHNGRLDVRGKETAASYRILREIAHGKIVPPRPDDDQTQATLRRLGARLDKRIGQGRIAVPSVLGVGWRQSETFLGARFDLTDGAVLQYYHGGCRLLVQGRPSEPVREALGLLPSPFWGGLDALTDQLRKIFPDWRCGQRADSESEQEMDDLFGGWQEHTDALGWTGFWPAQRGFRQAASLRESVPCQRALAEDWASVLIHHRGFTALLAHAPTGLGKTAAALAPALAWVAQQPERRRVYYLVGRVAQHENPLRELRDGLAELFGAQAGQTLRVVDLVGRAQLCAAPQAQALPRICRRSREEASFDQLPTGVPSWADVREHLQGRGRCAYHTLQALMGRAHVVICDYWWLFSELAQTTTMLSRSGISPRDSIVVVDEAHNLPVRARAALDINESLDRARERAGQAPAVARACLDLVLGAVRRAQPDTVLAASVLLAEAGGRHAVEEALGALVDTEPTERRLDSAERLLRLLLQPDSATAIYRSAGRDGGERVVGRLIDPTAVLACGFGHVHASLVMSGTLAAPTDSGDELLYHVPLFGLPTATTLPRKYAAPFPLRHQQWIYCPDTCGTVSQRQGAIPLYVEHITAIGAATPGVTAVFFSSYDFLEQVRGALPDEERSLVVAEQRTENDAADLDTYRHQLDALVQRYRRAFLFAVYQGQIAEGASFHDNMIKTVVCVSVPVEYPQLYHQRLAARLQQVFEPIAERRGDPLAEKAHEYALRRLTLSLILQACGRGIRSETDRCAFVLLDRRYGPGEEGYDWRSYLLPSPYNLGRPARTVRMFHQPEQITEMGWDRALLEACRGEQ